MVATMSIVIVFILGLDKGDMSACHIHTATFEKMQQQPALISNMNIVLDCAKQFFN